MIHYVGQSPFGEEGEAFPRKWECIDFSQDCPITPRGGRKDPLGLGWVGVSLDCPVIPREWEEESHRGMVGRCLTRLIITPRGGGRISQGLGRFFTRLVNHLLEWGGPSDGHAAEGRLVTDVK